MDEIYSEPDEAARPSPDDPDAEALLLANLRQRAAELDGLLESCTDRWGFEDPVYRFYHQSFKVYAQTARQTRQLLAKKNMVEYESRRATAKEARDAVERASRIVEWAAVTVRRARV